MNPPVRPLGEVVEYIRGITFKPEDKVDPRIAGAVVCMRTKNVQETLDESDLIAVPRDLVRREELYLRAGDILVSSANSWNLVGKCCWVPALGYAATAGGFISVLRSTSEIYGRYLFHWLVAPNVQARIRNCARQTTNIANLSVPQFEALELPVPPISEQRRIADILDKADAILRKRKEAIALTEELLQSAFLEMFGDPVTNPKGWSESSLEALCRDVVDCPHTTPTYEGALRPYPCVRSSDLQNGFLDLSTAKHVSDIEYRSRVARLQPKAGDILYSREGARFGMTALIPVGVELCLGQRMMLMRVNETVATPEFVWATLNSPAGYRQAAALVGGTASPHVNVKDVRRFRVLHPPLPLQRSFADICHRVVRVRNAQLSSVLHSTRLSEALAQHAFRGELTTGALKQLTLPLGQRA